MSFRMILVVLACLVAAPAYSEDHVVNSVTVVDANGVVIGPAQGTTFNPHVILRFEGRIFAVSVIPDGFRGDGPLFGLLDCQGQAFVHEPALIPHAALWTPGKTVYLAQPSAPTQTLNVKSTFIGELQQCVNGTPFDANVVPAVSGVDLQTVFAPPFSVNVEPSESPAPSRIPSFFKWPPF